MTFSKIAFAASLSMVVGFVGCGSSSKSGADGGTGGTTHVSDGGDGAAGAGGSSNGSGGSTTATGGADGGSNCGNIPSCISTLFRNCIPSGACTTQADAGSGTFSGNSCYANGVKVAESVATSQVTITWSNAAGICLSEVATVTATADGGSSDIAFTIRNGAGTTIATGSNANGTMSVTCGGQTYDMTDQGSCNLGGSGATCTQGTCP